MTREEAIYRLKNMAWLYGSAEREQNIEAIDMAIEALSAELPLTNLKQKFASAEAVQGEWIMHVDDLFPCESTQECSVCHHHQPMNIYDDNFCPNCGAMMYKGGDTE